MTRKRYLRKCYPLHVAVHKMAEENGDPCKTKLGESIRYQRDHIKLTPVGSPEGFHSYQEAWDALESARKFYGLD